MHHADYLVDILDDTGAIIGRKRRCDLNKATDIHHTAFIFLTTAPRRLVCSLIPALSQPPTLYGGQYGATVATIRRSDEKVMQAAERGVTRELGVHAPQLRELGGQMLLLPNNVKILATAFTMSGEMPEHCSPEDTDMLDELSFERVRKQLRTHPNRFAPTFIQLWEAYGHLIAS